jgi:hypothetical protein
MRSGVVIARCSATIFCLAATLLVAACGSPTTQDFPAFSLTNTPDSDRTSEPGGR